MFGKSKPRKKKGFLREWFDAIIFAVIAATLIRMFVIEAFTIPTPSMEKSLLVGDFLFVSKLSYGPRTPITPIAFPFAHHTLPLTANTKSYVEWIKLPYFRFPGFSEIKRNDVVVFNYPMEADPPLNRPVDKRENYIKRCVAIAGDTLQVKKRELYINNKPALALPSMQHSYHVKTDGSSFNPKVLEKFGINEGGPISGEGDYQFTLSNETAEELKSFSNVRSVTPLIDAANAYADYIFPSDTATHWNKDNFGPLVIPKKGATVTLSLKNISLYKRLITVYEHNRLEINGNTILINGNPAEAYTFKMNYYFMMGDNRHNSLDGRFWGFVPEDHIVGKAVFIWLSLEKNAPWYKKVRWSRLFSFIK